ncbi:MAG: DUF4435 domain-containing protein [Candidatus Eremiobacteraeota bacterium]|nr:DUF4435 domain-containing protein [Candidatus Eremiobacteraeota bacterium]
MRELLGPNIKANEIRMQRQIFKGSFMIVEGKTDSNLFENFVDNKLCEIIIAEGKENAVKILEILEEDGFGGFLAIIDNDFREVDGISHESLNLFLTDTHDVESMILKSPTLEKIINEFGSPDKLTGTKNEIGKEIRRKMLKCSKPIGHLRWISLKRNLELDFKDLKFSKFIKKDELTIDIGVLIKKVKDNSNKHEIDENEIKREIDELQGKKINPWLICCGHDMVWILSIGLMKLWGSNNTGEVNPDILEKALRLGYDLRFFRETKLYESMCKWEETNSPYLVFPKQ